MRRITARQVRFRPLPAHPRVPPVGLGRRVRELGGRPPWRPRNETVALVLSGGGARSSFQIGALRYLYDRVGITPQVITGTSAGSILGSVLAQFGDHEGQVRALDTLERLWRDMQDDSDMFTELQWYARLRERGPAWMEAFSRRERRQGPLGRSFARAASLTSERLGRPPDTVRTATATQEPAAGSTWNPVSVVDMISALREVGRARPDLEIIVRGAERERSMYRPGPIVDRLLDPDVFLPSRVATSGVTLRVAVVGLESGELRYVTETGRLVDRENRPVPDEPAVDLAEAVRASCAIPAVFPPVRLGSENYVDGGVREILPTEVAVKHLGARTVYAVVAPSSGVPPQPDYGRKDMLSIVLRSTAGIMSDEELRDEVAYAHAVGAVVIHPEIDVHDALTIDPGLTAIAMAYGWFRAAEVVHGVPDARARLTRDLIELRREIWSLETELYGEQNAAATDAPPATSPTAAARPPAPAHAGTADDGDREQLARLKHRLRTMVDRMPGDELPPDARQWWRRFEGHPFEITEAPYWT